LTAAQAGATVLFSGTTAAQTLTLPALAAVPGGATFQFQNLSSVSVTISAVGAEQIVVTTAGVGASTATTVVLATGCSIEIVSGTTGWYEHSSIRSAGAPKIVTTVSTASASGGTDGDIWYRV
jgi:hypothetical protein